MSSGAFFASGSSEPRITSKVVDGNTAASGSMSVTTCDPSQGGPSASASGLGQGAWAPPPKTVADFSPQPLRMVAVGPCLMRGGAEQWLINFARFVNPRRLRLLRMIVTEPRWVDPEFVADLPVPYEVGQSAAIRSAVQEADVLVGWGVGLDEYLGTERPKLCLYIAHGEGEWTRVRLLESRGAIDHVVAVSQRVADAIGPQHSTTVIHNGVDSHRLGQSRSRADVRASFGFSQEDFVLGYVGRFSREKQVERIILAAAELPSHFKVMLVGWGGGRQDLLDLANDRIPGRFAFTCAAHYMGDYYQAMDAFCLVSREEGYSLALLEAMMCGRPAIVTPVGSVPEVILDRINGVVVPGTPSSIAEAARLLRSHPEWARAVGREARSYAEEHGHSCKMVRQYEDLIERLWLTKQPSLSV